MVDQNDHKRFWGLFVNKVKKFQLKMNVVFKRIPIVTPL